MFPYFKKKMNLLEWYWFTKPYIIYTLHRVSTSPKFLSVPTFPCLCPPPSPPPPISFWLSPHCCPYLYVIYFLLLLISSPLSSNPSPLTAVSLFHVSFPTKSWWVLNMWDKYTTLSQIWDPHTIVGGSGEGSSRGVGILANSHT